jgi:hypothetical protein
LGDAGEDGPTRRVEVADEFDAEPVFLERNDGARDGLVVWQRGEAACCLGRLHW